MSNEKELNPNQLIGLLGDLLNQINEKDLKDFLAKFDSAKVDDVVDNIGNHGSLQQLLKMAKQNKIPISNVVQLVMKYALENKKK